MGGVGHNAQFFPVEAGLSNCLNAIVVGGTQALKFYGPYGCQRRVRLQT